jgi:hypothetical protein
VAVLDAEAGPGHAKARRSSSSSSPTESTACRSSPWRTSATA